jgi:hypothetical protein
MVYTDVDVGYEIQHRAAGDAYYHANRSKAFVASVHDRIVAELPEFYHQRVEWKAAVAIVFDKLLKEGILVKWGKK